MTHAGSITRIDREAARDLGVAPRETGRVHSVFARAVNVEWLDGRLLVLQGPGPLLAPFAAAIDRLSSLRDLPAGTPVTIAPPRLLVGSLALSWADAELVDCSVGAGGYPADPPPLHRLDSPGAHAPGLDSTTGVEARAQLTAGIRDRDARRLAAGARALIGLGEGLTPAGDDCLVGALAVLHQVDGGWLRREPAALAAIARAAGDRTTTVGRAFVLHALAGRFSEPVLAVLRAAAREQTERAAARLLALGATSGADTLSGMRLACRALGA